MYDLRISLLMAFKIYLITFFVLNASAILVPWFKDRTETSGLQDLHPRRKYGGPSIADLDGDGNMDLLLSHHDSTFMEVYFNNGNGTFTKSTFRRWHDIHGIIPFSAFSLEPKRAILSLPGGVNMELSRFHLLCLKLDRIEALLRLQESQALRKEEEEGALLLS